MAHSKKPRESYNDDHRNIGLPLTSASKLTCHSLDGLQFLQKLPDKMFFTKGPRQVNYVGNVYQKRVDLLRIWGQDVKSGLCGKVGTHRIR